MPINKVEFMCDSKFDAEFVESIAPHVLALLEKECFFERLDDRFSPTRPSAERALCNHSFSVSTSILQELGMGSDDVDDILAVLTSRGACCDCEVLYNVAEESRLKAQYWSSRNLERGTDGRLPQRNSG